MSMDLTKEIELRFDLARSKGRLPRKDSLAKTYGITEEEAQSLQNQWKRKHGERVRGVVVEEVVEEGPVSVKKNWIRIIAEHAPIVGAWLVDGGALLLAVIIDLILNVVVFVTIAPDPLTKLGMAGLAFLVVLFSVRGWLKGGWAGKSLWALFALVATFSDLSFALYVTDVQSKTATDTELVRLTDEAKVAGEYLEALQKLQLEKGQGYAQQVKDAREALGVANASVSSYVAKDVHAGLTAAGVFSAIPDAVKSNRWVELAFFSLIFVGLQLTIVSAAGVRRKDNA